MRLKMILFAFLFVVCNVSSVLCVTPPNPKLALLEAGSMSQSKIFKTFYIDNWTRAYMDTSYCEREKDGSVSAILYLTTNFTPVITELKIYYRPSENDSGLRVYMLRDEVKVYANNGEILTEGGAFPKYKQEFYLALGTGLYQVGEVAIAAVISREREEERIHRLSLNKCCPAL